MEVHERAMISDVAVADPAQPATPTTAQAGYSTYNPYGAPQTAASTLPDPYAPTTQPATAPGTHACFTMISLYLFSSLT